MGYRNYAVTNGFIVDQTGNGDFKTIAAATAAATSGTIIGIRQGTYTENITMKSGLSYVTMEDSYIGTPGKVIIVGKWIDNGASIAVLFKGMTLQTNGDFICVLTGLSNIEYTNCYFNCTNNTGFSLGNSGAAVQINHSQTDIGTTGISLYSITAGNFLASYCNMLNSGNSTTAGTFSSGNLSFFYCKIHFPSATTSTAVIQSTFCEYGNILTPFTNVTWLTTAGTGGATISNCLFFSGSASAISVGSGTNVYLFQSLIYSTNTNAITGAGVINYAGISLGSSTTINTTTQNATGQGKMYIPAGVSFDNTNFLQNYVTGGTWTPVLSFGGGTTGITYSLQSGHHTRIGNIVAWDMSIVLTNKGSSTGAMSIAGLPFAVANPTTCAANVSTMTFTGLLTGRLIGGGTTGMVIDNVVTTGARTTLDNTNFANTTLVQMSGIYLI